MIQDNMLINFIVPNKKLFIGIHEISELYNLEFDKFSLEKYIKQIILIFNNKNFNKNKYNLADSNILIIIGLYYMYVKKDYDNGIEYLKKSANLNNTIAMIQLGQFYKINDNYDLAKEYFIKAMELKNCEAIYKLGCMYEHKLLDMEMAIYYYKLATENGNIQAMNDLGYYYQFRNFEVAEKYYLMAIENNNINSYSNLAYCYEKILNDYDKAKKYYELGAKFGDTSAMNNFGYYYETVEKDIEMAKKYYQMGISNGDPDAMSNLAIYLDECENNPTDAIKYYLMAIKSGNVLSMYKLGRIYEKQSDYKLAIKYYMMASKNDCTESMHRIGLYFANVISNYKLAEKYFRKEVQTEKKNIVNLLEEYCDDNNLDYSNIYNKCYTDYKKDKKDKYDSIYKLGVYYESIDNDIDSETFFYIKLYDFI